MTLIFSLIAIIIKFVMVFTISGNGQERSCEKIKSAIGKRILVCSAETPVSAIVTGGIERGLRLAI